MRSISLFIALGLLASAAGTAHAGCEREASGHAQRLLNLHVGDDFKNASSFDDAKPIAPLKNPLKPTQVFRVLEVKGYVAPRGTYRMRFIFAPEEIGCVLLGQEILELTKL